MHSLLRMLSTSRCHRSVVDLLNLSDYVNPPWAATKTPRGRRGECHVDLEGQQTLVTTGNWSSTQLAQELFRIWYLGIPTSAVGFLRSSIYVNVVVSRQK